MVGTLPTWVSRVWWAVCELSGEGKVSGYEYTTGGIKRETELEKRNERYVSLQKSTLSLYVSLSIARGQH